MSGSNDHTLKVWNVSSGECLRTLSGHTSHARRRRPVKQRVDRLSTPRRAQVYCVVVLSNGHVVSGSGDDTLKVWDPSSGQCLRTLTGHRNGARRRRPVEPRVDRSSTRRGAQVFCVAALSNGRVVSGSRDNTLKLWDVATGECLATWKGHSDYVRRRGVLDEKGLSFSLLPRPKTSLQVFSVAVFPNGDRVVSSANTTLRLWG